MTAEWLKFFADALADSSRHFLFSGLAGLSGYSLTQIILCACGWAWERGTRRRLNTAVAFGIVLISLLAALACALLAHVALDYYSAWYSAPLGPPITIDRGPGA